MSRFIRNERGGLDEHTSGEPGAPGAAATIAVGTVTTGAAGSSASVTNAGTSSAAIFNFTIPKGDAGVPGSGISFVTPPTTGGSPGSVGQFACDAQKLYVCYATNAWKYLPLFAMSPVTLIYASDGDTNGAVYFLGFSPSSQVWTNPSTGGTIFITTSGDNTGSDIKASITDRSASNYSTIASSGAFVQLDLGSSRSLVINRYSYRFRNDTNTFCPTAWKLEASNNGTTWVTIDSQSGLTPAISAWVSPTITGQTTGYRYWRISQVGTNNNGTNHFSIGELELYGVLTF